MDKRQGDLRYISDITYGEISNLSPLSQVNLEHLCQPISYKFDTRLSSQNWDFFISVSFVRIVRCVEERLLGKWLTGEKRGNNVFFFVFFFTYLLIYYYFFLYIIIIFIGLFIYFWAVTFYLIRFWLKKFWHDL